MLKNVINTKAVWKLRRQTGRKRGQDFLDQFTRQGKTRQWKQMSAPRVLPPSLDGEGDRTEWSHLLSEHFKQVLLNLPRLMKLGEMT